MIDFPFKPEDQAHDAETVEQIAERVSYEGELSALSAAQCLELLGKFGAIQSVLLRVLRDPNRRSHTAESRAIRTALGLANEGVLIAQAVTMTTVRRMPRGR